MKAKTKLQHEVLEHSYYFPCIENKMLDWAKTSVLKHIGYATKNRVICMDCGEKFSPELVKRKRATCPHCQQKLVIEESRKSTFEQRTYVASAQVVNDFQVIRNFEVRCYHKVGKSTKYYINEILQHWYLNDKKREVIAVHHYVSFGCDRWSGNMEIRDKGTQKFWESSVRYDVYPEKYHPDSVFKPEYEKYGINHKLEGFTFLEAVSILPYNPQAETLLKAKQYSLASAFRFREENKIRRHWDSIKICMRNKYIVSDSWIWFDYLDLLYYFQKDRRNTHYVCPRDLNKAHDRLMDKKRAIQKREELEKKKLRTFEQEASFKALKEKFMGLSFSDGLILIKVLESVQEYVEEGDKLHHCVFTNDYFSKPDSLVLSARIENEPIETIEISLKDFKVLQCRGKHNQDTEYHDRIIQLVNKNIKKVKQRLKQTA